MSFPSSADELLALIEQLVPERVPDATDDMNAIQRYAGKRELVLMLRHKREAARTGKRQVASPKGRR